MLYDIQNFILQELKNKRARRGTGGHAVLAPSILLSWSFCPLFTLQAMYKILWFPSGRYGVNYFLNGCQLDNSWQYMRLFSIASNLWDDGAVSCSIAGFNLCSIVMLVWRYSCEILMRIVNMIRRCLSGVNSARRAPPADDARFSKSPPRELSVNCSFAPLHVQFCFKE